MVLLQLFAIMLLWFLTPVVIFCAFWKFGKPFWSYAVYLPLLLGSIVKNIFWYELQYGTYRGFWRAIHQFMNNDSAMMFYFWWLPGIIGFVLIHIIYFVYQRKKANK